MRRWPRGDDGIDIDTAARMAAARRCQRDGIVSAWEFFRRLIWKRKETLPSRRSCASCALGPGRERRPHGSRTRRRRPADHAALQQFDLARLDEPSPGIENRLPHNHGGAGEGTPPADRRRIFNASEKASS